MLADFQICISVPLSLTQYVIVKKSMKAILHWVECKRNVAATSLFFALAHA